MQGGHIGMMRRTGPTCVPGRAVGAILAVALVLASLPEAARADYRLDVGDEVELIVFRIPELSRSAVVDVDGRIAIPPLGTVVAAGSTVDELSSRIRVGLVEQMDLDDAQVTVSLEAPRPVFVGGDVAEPGAHPYRSILTVRRALALAGGVGPAGGADPVQAARLRSELELTEMEIERERVRAARLEAELAGRGTLVDVSAPAALLAVERARLADDLADSAAERAQLERRVKLAEARLDRLRDQEAVQEELMGHQREELQRTAEIVDRGLALRSRAADEQRDFSLMQERLSDTVARIAEAEAGIAEARYARSRFDGRRKAALRIAADEARRASASATARQAGIAEQLLRLGEAGRLGFDVTVYRIRDGSEVAVPMDEGGILQPGDMVDVTAHLPTDAADDVR